MRGIVMEVGEGRAVVMSNTGVPQTVRAKAGWQVGDVVSLPGRAVPFRAMAAVAACFVLLVTLAFSGYGMYTTQTTLVSIDVNPSLELSINRFDRVIAVHSLNPAAGGILDGLALKGLRHTDAVALLMGTEGLDAYIDADASLVISVQSDDTARQEALLAELRQVADAALRPRHANAAVTCLPVDQDVVERAHGHGMSAGKYMLVQELAELQPDIDIDAYSHHSVGDIQGEIQAHRHRQGWEQAAEDDDGNENGNGNGIGRPEPSENEQNNSEPPGHNGHGHGQGQGGNGNPGHG